MLVGYSASSPSSKHARNVRDDSQGGAEQLFIFTHGIDVYCKLCRYQWHCASASFTLGSGQTKILVQELPKKMISGDIWTVAMDVEGDPGMLGYGGRMIPEIFPIETWPHSSDCPLPGLNDDNWNQISDAGIDTVFITGSKCGDVAGTISKLGETNATARAWTDPSTLAGVENSANVGAVFLGDEVDGDMDNLRPSLQQALDAYSKYPRIPTCQGAKTNSHVGSFAGHNRYSGHGCVLRRLRANNGKCSQNTATSIPILLPEKCAR